MNDAFYKFALERINTISDEELIAIARDNGIELTRKDNMDKQELRLYTFVNHYLATGGPHAGIQSGHAAVDLVRKYAVSDDVPAAAMVVDWADNYKTMIVLNGGMHQDMLTAKALVEESGYPFAVFHESEEALDGVMTCIAVVLPEEIFNMRRIIDGTYACTRIVNDVEVHYTARQGDKNFDFIDMLKSKGLAK